MIVNDLDPGATLNSSVTDNINMSMLVITRRVQIIILHIKLHFFTINFNTLYIHEYNKLKTQLKSPITYF